MRSDAALADPSVALERLRARGLTGPGAVLLESCGPELPTTRRSILVPRPLLRVEARGGRVRAVPLLEMATPLLDALGQRWPGAVRGERDVGADFPPSTWDPALTDDERLRAPSILDALRAVVSLVGDRSLGSRMAAPALPPGLFGAFAYDLVDHFEALPPRRPARSADADFTFVLGTELVVWERAAGEVQVVSRALPWERAAAAGERHRQLEDALAGDTRVAAAVAPAACMPAPVEAGDTDAAFLADVERFLAHIRQGDIFQGVLARTFTMASAAPPLAVYRALRANNPSPYMFYLELEDGALLGASPETFLRVENGELELRPIAGTARRGRGADGAIDPDLDDRMALALLLDAKEQAEHAMLLDLARNDVARVAQSGTCRVVQQFAIEKYGHVQHLVSRVRGALRPGLDALHAYRGVANMGTLTGAPKLEAMAIIRNTEPTARGFYGGAAGYLLQDGRMDTCIVIRSLRQCGAVYRTGAGAGIVQGSVPQHELDEIAAKALACRIAVAMAAGGET